LIPVQRHEPNDSARLIQGQRWYVNHPLY
jgi:hypothetical protein